jgi:hypothetical protein
VLIDRCHVGWGVVTFFVCGNVLIVILLNVDSFLTNCVTHYMRKDTAACIWYEILICRVFG